MLIKSHKKRPAPVAAEQVNQNQMIAADISFRQILNHLRNQPNILRQLYAAVREMREVSDLSETCTLLNSGEWVCLRVLSNGTFTTHILARVV